QAPQKARMIALAEGLPLDWRVATGSRFSVVIRSYAPDKKISVIKVIREITGQGLAEAKATSERLPVTLFECTTFVQAVGYRERFGPVIDLRVEPCGPIDHIPEPCLHRVYAGLWNFDGGAGPPEALEAFAAFAVRFTGLTLEDARRRAAEGEIIL